MRENPPENQEKSDKFIHKRSLGQNFLTSTVVPNWMCEAGEVKNGDIILEIGPGTGMLTKVLLERGAIITAVEADERAITTLNEMFQKELKSGQLTIHHGDAREITPEILGLQDCGFKVVANIPYYLSGFLLRTLLESPIQPSNLTFLIQKELAERIARDEKESILSLSVKVFGNPMYKKNVARGHFYPKPKVDSAILSIYHINQNNFTHFKKELFFKILHLGLGNKRKQLLSNLSKEYPRTVLEQTFSELSIPLNIRGEDLKLETWLKLCEKLNIK
ncbi:MAG: ribosomal RNA small subunit methyltransferase A [Candidatus Pacebacteria bacterium]|nr:ribosomal RNA small subunit methyltransferase A [Candidatus Paceibacterota bacterium]